MVKSLGKNLMNSVIEDFTKGINKSEFKDKGIFLRKKYLI